MTTTGEPVIHQEAEDDDYPHGKGICAGCGETWPCVGFATATAERPTPNTTNEFLIQLGQNLPNHTESRRGRQWFVRQGVAGIPAFRTRDQVYRYAAWLLVMAEVLPSEGDTEFSFEEVLDAVRNA